MPSGSYGKVLFSKDNDVAYKFLFKSDKKIYGSSSLKEIDFLKRCEHPNIVKIEEIIISKNTNEYDMLGISMKKADCNLYEFFKKNTIDKYQFRDIIYQTLLSLLYIHSHFICHRDIKADNFLMYGKTVKLSDFGLSTNLLNEWNSYELCSIRRYRAPEIICKKRYNFGVDIWALGCIIYELYNDNTCLFRGNTSSDVLNVIINKVGITKKGISVLGLKCNPSNFKLKMNNPHLLDLLKGMLDTNPETRFTALDCLHSHYFVSLGSGYFYTVLQLSSPTDIKKSEIFLREDVKEKFTKGEITLAYDIYIRFNRNDLTDRVALVIRNVCLYISHKILSKEIKPYDELFTDVISEKTYKRIELKILDELKYNIFRFTFSDYMTDDEYDLDSGLIVMENLEYEITLNDMYKLYCKTVNKSHEDNVLSPLSDISVMSDVKSDVSE